jgi:CBS domain-containing protein
MHRDVVTLRMRERTSVILAALQSSTHHAFPVVSTTTDEHGRLRERFVGLVTREDVHVYLSLPALEHYAANAELSARQQRQQKQQQALQSQREQAAVAPGDVDFFTAALNSAAGEAPPAQPTADTLSQTIEGTESRVPAAVGVQQTEEDMDGFGGVLPAAIARINKMSWTDWMTHQTSLFFVIGSRRWHQSWGDGRAHSERPNSATVTVPSSTAAMNSTMLPPVVDLSLIVNRSPWVVPPYFNLSMTYSSFRSMGLRHLVVIDGDDVKGIITRKELLVNTLKQKLQALHGHSVLGRQTTSSARGENASHQPRSESPHHTLADVTPGKKQRLLDSFGGEDE